MRSLRTKMTLLTIFAIIIAVVSVTVLSVMFIRNTEHKKSDQLLLLLCETGEKNLDYYFNSVQKSVRKLATYVEADLDGMQSDQLERHVEHVKDFFEETASKTNGVLTYYYRIDPSVSDTVTGFWYTDLDGEGFVEHEVTDITLYDTEDTSGLVWFTVPKHMGEAIWIPPYITDNLDVRVISYNVPIYWRGNFIGVVGIELDYSTMAEQVESIRLFNNGYAFLSDAEGKLFYHPLIDVTRLSDETMPEVPDGMLQKNTFFRYEYEGVEKVGAWLPLSNGMRLNVTVPVSETEGDWQKLIINIVIMSVEVMAALSIFTMLYTRRITKPLEELTDAAEQVDKGNYEFTLDYGEDDEIGRLTNTFRRLADHMKEHISDLSKRAYIDSLTTVRNKGAYSGYIEQLETRMKDAGGDISFAVGMFDCDDLKQINDIYGHEKGDVYIITASRLICRIYKHSPVFRIGGDEFSVILQNEDYLNRDELAQQFSREMEESCVANKNKWEQVHISMGVAVYDPKTDRSVNDVIRRADTCMYDNKRSRKRAK